ncbi:unnamed protein product, partial [Rotaria sp. Silwood1]
MFRYDDAGSAKKFINYLEALNKVQPLNHIRVIDYTPRPYPDIMTTANEISFIISQKGNKMLNINNFIFKLNKTTSTTKYYRCEDSRCTVTARTDLQDTILNIKGDHCHPPEPEEIQIRTFKQVVKTRAISESTPIPQIYDE